MALVETLILAIVSLSTLILFIKDRIMIVLVYAAISTIAVVVFAIYSAPDVALAEASIGLVFTIFLYMVVLQHRGKLWVALVKVADSIDELQVELLSSYCEFRDLNLRILKLNLNEALRMLEEGRVEVVAGALVNEEKHAQRVPLTMTNGFLETKLIYFGKGKNAKFLGGFSSFDEALKAFKNKEIDGFYSDLFRYLNHTFKNHVDLIPKGEERGVFYSFAVIDDEPELLLDLNDYLTEMEKSGELKKIVERHVR